MNNKSIREVDMICGSQIFLHKRTVKECSGKIKLIILNNSNKSHRGVDCFYYTREAMMGMEILACDPSA